MFSPVKEYSFVSGYVRGAKKKESARALPFTRACHDGQYRKSGEPYVIHPLTMACNAIGLGIEDDDILATVLLHDVCEDCDVGIDDLPVNEHIRHSVDLLTFRVLPEETKEMALQRYYDNIIEDRAATLTKLIDRANNLSTMAGVFSKEKLKAYIEETRNYVFPLLKQARKIYPADSNILFLLQYHMLSVVESIEGTISTYEQGDEGSKGGN